jgi:hypothetical protein
MSDDRSIHDETQGDGAPLHCAHCGEIFQWAWVAVGGTLYCHDCFYERLYSWAGPTIPTDDDYQRRLL